MPIAPSFRRTTKLNCCEGQALFIHKLLGKLIVGKNYCRNWGCPHEECRKFKSNEYIDYLADVGRINKEFWVGQIPAKKWKSGPKFILNRNSDVKYLRISYRTTDQFFAIATADLTPKATSFVPLPQMEAFQVTRKFLMREDIKRVDPKPNTPGTAFWAGKGTEKDVKKVLEDLGIYDGEKLADSVTEAEEIANLIKDELLDLQDN